MPKSLIRYKIFFKRAQEDKDIVMDGISIIGYASPEGTYEHNMMLSQKKSQLLCQLDTIAIQFPIQSV